MTACTQFLPTHPYGHIIIANPPRNTLPHPVFADYNLLREMLGHPALKGVVVRGEGDHFCGGLARSVLDAHARTQAIALLDIIRYAPVPVVAAIRGDCIGAGLDIARACHFRVAGRSAQIGYRDSSPRLVSDSSDTYSSGSAISGTEALAAKLVDTVCDDADVDREALSLLESLTGRRPAFVVHAAMVSIGNAQRLAPREALVRESLLFRDLAMRSDALPAPEQSS